MPVLVRLKLDRLRDLIARGSLSQNHWALKIGISRGHWSEIVNGKHPYPSPKTRERMLEVFGVDFDDLFETVDAAAQGADPTFHAAIADRYAIDTEVGHGGMGTVYVARDVKLGRTVAIKVLAPEAVSGVGADQFLKEIRYTARLQHPNVLGLHDAGQAAGFPFYVMPYIRGGSLRDLLNREGRLPLDRALAIARGIGAALDHAHEHHLLHCDVKPENVLLDSEHVYVADFGVARAIHAEVREWGRQTTLDSSAGTPAYVSPEHASGEPNLDRRSDVYSLACVTHEMITGRPPFTGGNSMEIVARRFTSPPPDLSAHAPDVPRAVAHTVEQGMQLAPARRLQSAGEFVRDLEAAAGTGSPLPRSISQLAFALRHAMRRLQFHTPPYGTSTKGRIMEGIRQDIRQAVRSLRRVPGFTLVAMLTLALGIGANTAIFTLVNGVLLRPLPYDHPDELVMVWEFDTRAASLAAETRAMDADGKFTVSPANFVRWKERARSFTDLAAFNIWRPTLSGEGSPREVTGSIVTPNFFDLIGVVPVAGTSFDDGHAVPGANRAALVSEGFWQREFGADPSAVGRTIRLNGDPFTVIGVIPSTYRHPEPSVLDPVDVWAPIAFEEPHTSYGRYLRVIGRLRPGVAPATADAEMGAIARALALATPDRNQGWGAYVIPVREELFGNTRTAMFMLLGAAGFVFLMACANVANLVLARTQGRRKEFAVRTALGAGRFRLARQLVIENTIMALGGGMLGLVAVQLRVGYLHRLQGHYLSHAADIRVDGTVILFMILLAGLAGTLTGVLPLLRASRSDLRTPLMEDAPGSGVSRATRRLRGGLVVSQMALAAVLVVGAGLLLRSFVALMSVSPGFDVERVLTTGVILPRASYAEADRQRQFFDQLLPAVRTLPGVEEAALVSDLPFTTENRFTWVNPLDDIRPEGEELLFEYRTVGPGYFRAMGIGVHAGRVLTPSDVSGAEPVVVVNEEFAARLWPEQDPIGKRFVSGRNTTVTVVGVVANVLDDGYDGAAEPRFYRAFDQYPSRFSAIVLRTRGNDPSLPLAVQETILGIDRNLLVREFRTMSDVAAGTVAEDRMALSLAGGISLLAVLLAAVGIYGVMSYTVGERRREIGIRSALGAPRGTVMRLVMGHALLLTVSGAVGGVLIAVVLSRTLSSMLFGVQPTDPLTLLAAPIVLASVAMLASYLPASRATLVSPTEALRGPG